MRRTRQERGQAMLFIMLAMIPMCMIVGLVVDVGMAYSTKTSARTAAEMGALAAVQSAIDSIYSGGSYSCGSLGCQSADVCPTSGNLKAVCLYATTNGFTNAASGAQTVQVSAGTGTPPVPNVTSANYWVKVQIAQRNGLTFGAMSGLQWVNPTATAVAAAVNVIPENCVVALDRSAASALNLTGNVNLTTTDCGVAVNSSSSSALTATGSTILSASSISVVGGTSTGGTTVSPTPITGVAPFPDPLEGIPAPTVPSVCNNTFPHNPAINSTLTLSPGTYCGGLNIGANANVTFNPGTYYMVGGGISVSGSAALTGSGVTFYNTFNATYAFQPINMVGTGATTLSAPTSGSLQGILFFEDRNAPTGNTSTIKGNSNASLAGAVYIPKNTLTFSGDATSQQLMLVADQVSMNGNVTLSINPESTPTPLTPQIVASLIQ